MVFEEKKCQQVVVIGADIYFTNKNQFVELIKNKDQTLK